MKRTLNWNLNGMAILLTGAMGLSLASSSMAAIAYLGVASGDASSTDAVLWTRAVDTNAPAAASLTAQVSTDSGFGSSQSFPVSTVPANDYTAKVVATGLTAGTRYYYRFTDGTVTSLTGTFKTAPASNAVVPVSFAFSGDVDGLIRPYALAGQIPNKNLDFFMFDGDTIYETSASIGSPAVTSTASATKAQLAADFSRKYREQFLPVNNGGQNCLQTFYAGQGNYTAYDNHELGNKQYINGGAPAGAAISTDPVNLPTGTGFTGKVSDGVDVNTSVYATNYMNKSAGFQTLQQVYMNYQPAKERGIINTGSDARTDGTRQLYFAQQWGKNVVLVNVDDRTYRDIRLKLNDGSTDDTTSLRADNTGRTMLGATQLAWLEQTLLAAETNGTPWKFINISDPIDQIGPIGGALALANAPTVADYGTLGSITSTTTTKTNVGTTITVASTVGLVVGQPVTGAGIAASSTIKTINTDGTTFVLNNAPTSTVTNGEVLSLSPAVSTYGPVSADGGKSWMGGYRAERNALLAFIATNHIRNVVFLATDDHQNRINELTYSTNGNTWVQSTYAKVPYCFEVVCGPLGATGPDFIQNHSFALAKKLADSIATAQSAAGVEPIGLAGYPGLHNVVREGDSAANTTPQAADFYSPDTFNYNKFDVSADGKTLTITSYGINSTVQNAFPEYDAANNPERPIFSFQVDAARDLAAIDHIIVVYQENWSFDSLYGYFPGANGIANASLTSLNQLDRISGQALSSESGANNYINASKTSPTQNTPPQPITYSGVIDTNFPANLNTLLPYNAANYVAATNTTGDIVHRYWQEQFQIDHGSNDLFVSWSDNPGLVMSYYDASSMPEGLLAQQYVMCDNFFHSAFGGSFLNHQYLIAAQPPVYPNAATLASAKIATLAANGLLATNANGRISNDQWLTPIGGVVFANTNQTFDKNYAVNTAISQNLANGNTPTAATFLPSQNDSNPSDPVRPYIPTIGDRLDGAGVSWKWYSGGWDRVLAITSSNPTNNAVQLVDSSVALFQWHHQPFAYYDNYAPWTNGVRNPRSAAHLQDEAKFFTDVTNSTLPAVSFIKPLGPDNEHPGYASLMQGQLHVSNIVAAVQSNPALWAHTAIIITYDEHGGRWDHVSPPARDIWGPGVRVPGIIISPLAKSNYVDHTQYETLSILKTIENRFGLAPLTAADAGAPSLAPAFVNGVASVPEPALPPSLNGNRVGNTVALTWPAGYDNYVLQMSTNLLSGNWVTLSNVAGNAYQTNSGYAQAYYRLIRP